jgi:hypothetical protein
MAIKHHIPGGKGTYWPPYSAAEKRQMDADLYRKPHSGPYVVVYPYARGAGPSLPGRSAAAVAAATNPETEATSQSVAARLIRQLHRQTRSQSEVAVERKAGAFRPSRPCL